MFPEMCFGALCVALFADGVEPFRLFLRGQVSWSCLRLVICISACSWLLVTGLESFYFFSFVFSF